jgi:ABC-type multidrug transport system fused ATPase/permease subunit
MCPASEDGPSKPGLIAQSSQSGQNLSHESQPERHEEKADLGSPKLEKLRPSHITADSAATSFDLKAWLQASVNRLAGADYIFQGSGVIFKNLSVSGTGITVTVQDTVGSVLMLPFRSLFLSKRNKKEELRILSDFSGLLRSGELLAVLGRPGSGCSTFLKAISGDLHGVNLDEGSVVNYNGRQVGFL